MKKSTFEELKKELKIFPQDEMALQMGLRYRDEWLRVMDEIDEVTANDRDGAKKLNPMARYARTCFDAYLEICKRFGLTPYDRKKLGVADRGNRLKNKGVPLRKIKMG